MEIIETELIEVTNVRGGKRRIVFRYFTNEGQELGPFVAHRPGDEDINAFLAEIASELQTPPEEE